MRSGFLIASFCLFLIGLDAAEAFSVSCDPRTKDCCAEAHKLFRRNWVFGDYYLTYYLRMLEQWDCPQFERECESRTFAFNDFAKLVYTRFCNASYLEPSCSKVVYEEAIDQTGSLPANWKDAVDSLKPQELSDDDIREPCLQMAMYERGRGGFGRYHEVIHSFVPFCEFVWCGVDEGLVKDGRMSVWTCMPKSCQRSVTIFMVFCVIFAFVIIVANGTVICTLALYSKTRHNQAMYRFSLALADILVGIVVFPTFASTLYRVLHNKHELGQLTNVNITSAAASGSFVTEQTPVRSVDGGWIGVLPQEYLDFVGFFTSLSLAVSVYTLGAAGVDRCYALYSPVRYQMETAVPVTLLVNIAIWLSGIVFAILPFGVPSLRYTTITALLVASHGKAVVYLYSIMLLIPLVMMWITSIASYVLSRRYMLQWSSCSDEDENKVRGLTENRLSRTLMVMVGVFSLSIVPSIVVLLVTLGKEDIFFYLPDKLSQSSMVAYSSAEAVVIFVLMSNSLWNCFIYSARDTSFRQASLSLYLALPRKLGLKCFKQTEETNQVTRCDDVDETVAPNVPYVGLPNGKSSTEPNGTRESKL